MTRRLWLQAEALRFGTNRAPGAVSRCVPTLQRFPLFFHCRASKPVVYDYPMKSHPTATETPPSLRAGVITLLVLALCYLAMTGLSDLPRVLAFTGLFAVCFVLMMKSMVDLLVWAFGLAARLSGAGLGHSVR